MKLFTKYLADESITETGYTSQRIEDIPLKEGEFILEGGANIHNDYINLDSAPTITNKGDYEISNLPLPCTVVIEGITYACTEQPNFNFNYPGSYQIHVDAGSRFLKKTFTLVQE